MYRIVTTADNRWAVLANWFGSERPVFTHTDLFTCINWEIDNS